MTVSGKAFAYVGTFEVLPEITLENLDRIEVEKPEVEITDGDREAMIENLRRQAHSALKRPNGVS